jgi:hypothetical protein
MLPAELLVAMKTLFLVVKLLFLFGGSGFCLGGPVGGVFGLILLICIVLQLTSGLRFRFTINPPANGGMAQTFKEVKQRCP